MKKFRIALLVLATCMASMFTATSVARADISHNGCTIKDSSVSLDPRPNYAKKPGVGFTINCITLTSWDVTTQCRVSRDSGATWSQCTNTSLIHLSAFNSGGSYSVLVGNGSWGCVSGNEYVGRVEFGTSGVWARSPNELLC